MIHIYVNLKDSLHSLNVCHGYDEQFLVKETTEN